MGMVEYTWQQQGMLVEYTRLWMIELMEVAMRDRVFKGYSGLVLTLHQPYIVIMK